MPELLSNDITLYYEDRGEGPGIGKIRGVFARTDA